jgi:spore germination protein KC
LKTIRALLLLVVLITLPGCWNRVELNEIAIISATAVDWEDGEWVLTYQIIIPKAISGHSGGSNGAAINVFSSRAENFRSAISKASQETSRQLYFSHNQIVIVGQDAARKGLGSLLEAYLRNQDSRETVNVFLSKSNARQLLEQLMPLEQNPGEAIHRMIGNEEANNSSFRQMTINDVLMDLLGSAQATGLPVLSLTGTGGGTERVQKLGQTSSPSKIRLSELGLIVGDKLVGWVDNRESSGINWLNNTVDRTTVGFACSDRKSAKKDSSIRVVRAESKRTPGYMDGKWRIDVDIKAEGSLLEYNCKGDISKPDKIEAIERLIEEEIRSTALSGWRAISASKADVVGFGNLIHKKYPKLWKQEVSDWRETFPATTVSVNVSFNLSTTGSSGNNFKQIQEDTGK